MYEDCPKEISGISSKRNNSFLILFVFETKDKKNPLKLIRGIELTEEDSSSVDLKYNTALPNRILLQSKLESKN